LQRSGFLFTKFDQVAERGYLAVGVSDARNVRG
jgi:hypothetical protein